MSKRIGLAAFVAGGLLLALALAAFISPHASKSPDGLDSVAQQKGFIDKAEGGATWTHAPAPEYQVPGVKNERVSTSLAGVLGTLAVFAVALGLAFILRKRRPDGALSAEQKE